MPKIINKPPLEVRYDIWSHPTFRWNGGSSDHLADARAYAVRHGLAGIRLVPDDDPDGPSRVNTMSDAANRIGVAVEVP